MGNWNLSIEGIGAHHNGIHNDVDSLAKQFVKILLEKGHTVTKASFTYGGAENIKETD